MKPAQHKIRMKVPGGPSVQISFDGVSDFAPQESFEDRWISKVGTEYLFEGLLHSAKLQEVQFRNFTIFVHVRFSGAFVCF